MDTNREAGASSCYCLKVRRANGIVTKFYDSLMAPSGVTVRQYSLLLHISRTEGISVRQLADQTGSESFLLPFSLSTLADYIATDRSAMMRELKRLRTEGVIQSSGRQITLCM